jgi:predicted secreted protein|tara:strand:+ start:2618 stop:3052 length:435 start_codon:yes stop_codon:yes gene_type:complete
MANGQLNGTDLGVYIAGTLVAYSTNATININHTPRSVTNKESGGFEENMEGLRNWDVSVDALYAWLDPSGSAISNETLSEIFTGYLAARAKFSLTFGVTTTGTGDTKYVGDAWLTSISLTAPLEDTATFSCSFQGTGALTQTIS